ncbi:hypothetical protein BT63DRAFT_482560 [Microthyrium microscopicum]|uniref:Cytochrome b561 domain-containing protein n=1 Tax=Microthyrium microscopicum TaxID=703497 RepID=A0A6A6U3E1_9PEZI|nr:hypothetical protein BT63DRAFT_482560 [Microthyrium microscopicum]
MGLTYRNHDEVTAHVHGILLSIAFCAIFPIGALIHSIFKNSNLWIAHAITQTCGLIFAITGLVFGFEMVYSFEKMPYHHGVLGLIIVATLCAMPFIAIMHRRLIAVHPHLPYFGWIHRTLSLICMFGGIINGAYGLKYSSAPRSQKIAYGLLAGICYGLWFGARIYQFVVQGEQSISTRWWGWMGRHGLTEFELSEETRGRAYVERPGVEIRQMSAAVEARVEEERWVRRLTGASAGSMGTGKDSRGNSRKGSAGEGDGEMCIGPAIPCPVGGWRERPRSGTRHVASS